MTVELSNTEIVTPPLRLAFPALFTPKPTFKGGDDKKYQAVCLIPPDVDLTPFFNCVKAAMIDKWGKLIKMPSGSNPIKPCTEKDLDGYADGWYYINTKSGYQPNVVDQKCQAVIDVERAYSGCWCRFHLSVYAWDHPVGGKGVSFSLNSVQLVRDDERLDGRRSAEEVFESIEVDDDTEGLKTSADADELFG
jgi:hypothetical protein